MSAREILFIIRDTILAENGLNSRLDVYLLCPVYMKQFSFHYEREPFDPRLCEVDPIFHKEERLQERLHRVKPRH